jgi:hypothetical protein
MSAKVTFIAAARGSLQRSTIVIPKNTTIKTGQKVFVWTIAEGRARQAFILIGSELETGLEVKSGLEGGETIIVTPPDSLRDGQLVTAKTS